MYLDIIVMAKKQKLKQLEEGVREIVLANKEGALFICPFCQYAGVKSNKKGTAKVFSDNGNLSFVCFNCRSWRKI